MAKDTQYRSLIQGFLESAQRFPARPALVVNDQSFTYEELRGRAARIAAAILLQEEQPFPLAAVLAQRSIAAYSGILGILSAGKGYVPLNPKFPVERTRRMLQLSGCKVLIVGSEALDHLPALLSDVDQTLTVILPDGDDSGALAADFPRHRFVVSHQMQARGDSSPLPEVRPGATAYLLFTSGSTGIPKGVPISQANVRSYVQYTCDRYQVHERDRFSQMFDLTFDLSVHDMFVCWERGACLYSVPERSVMAPAKFIRDHQLTMWFSVPSVPAALTKMRLLQPGSFPSLRYSLFCGEPLTALHAGLWQEAAANSVLENLYGPTETTIAISQYRWDRQRSPEECLNGIVPIGSVFEGQQARVVDADGRAVACGEAGELCLSGTQVSSGYLNNPEKTREQFVQLPGTGTTTWYRTGDLVKQDASGCLLYLGRIDHQVKIHGNRVELQEIEAALRQVSSAQQAIAIAWPVNNGSADGIVAFLSGLQRVDEQSVLEGCRTLLPSYMVPKRICLIDDWPLNANGKIDRKKLQEMLQGRQV